MSAIIDIHHRDLRPGNNARKHFPPGPLAELRESLREHGLQQNLVAYPDPEAPGKFILVAGERRWRATGDLLADLNAKGDTELITKREVMAVKILSLQEVPKARQLNLVENVNREGITPLEEADAYYEMSREINPATGAIYTTEEIAKVVGKKTSDGKPDEKFIRRRLKLRNAPEFFLEAVNRGEVGATIAEEIGKIPDGKLRELAATRILNREDEEAPMTLSQAKEEIRTNFMKSLVSCGFKTDAADLLSIAEKKAMGLTGAPGEEADGTCLRCPMRSGNNKDLADELTVHRKGGNGGSQPGISPDLCTNPACFRMKKLAAWAEVRAQAREQKRQVIDGDAAKKTFSGRDGGLAYDSKLIDLDAKMSYSDTGGDWVNQPPKWRAVTKGVDVPIVFALNPYTLNIHQLADKETLKKMIGEVAKAAGETSVFDKPKASASQLSASEKRQRAEAAMKAKVVVETAYRGARGLRETVAKKGFGLEETHSVFEIALNNSGADGSFFLGKMIGIKLTEKDKHGGSGRDYTAAILKHVRETATTKQEIESWIALAVVARDLKNSAGPYGGGLKGCEGFTKLAGVYNVDWKKMEGEVAAELKAGKKPAKKKAEKPALVTRSKSKAVRRNENAVSKDEEDKFHRKVEDYKCDQCRAELYVAPGKGNEAAALVKGKMKCTKHGGTWQLLSDFYVQNGLNKSGTKKVVKTKGKKAKEPEGNENLALVAYIKTGSLTAAATAGGVGIECVRNWYRRHDWKAKRIKADCGVK